MAPPLDASRAARRALAMAACAALAAACGDKAGAPAGDSAVTTGLPAPTAAATQNAEAQLADIADYRLSMDKVDKFLAAQRNMAMKAREMTPAQREAAASRNGPANSQNATIDDMARNIESEPLMHDAVKQAGLSAREFTMITMSLMQSGMAAGVAKMRPHDNQDSLVRAMKASPENVKFMRDNEAEIARKTKALETEMKQSGATDGEP